MTPEKEPEIGYHPLFRLGKTSSLNILRGKAEDRNGELVAEIALDVTNRNPRQLLADMEAGITAAIEEGRIPATEKQMLIERSRDMYMVMLRFG